MKEVERGRGGRVFVCPGRVVDGVSNVTSVWAQWREGWEGERLADWALLGTPGTLPATGRSLCGLMVRLRYFRNYKDYK